MALVELLLTYNNKNPIYTFLNLSPDFMLLLLLNAEAKKGLFATFISPPIGSANKVEVLQLNLLADYLPNIIRHLVRYQYLIFLLHSAYSKELNILVKDS